MEFDIQIAHSVTEVDQQAWDHLGGDLPFSSYRWYRFGETILKNDTPIYLILSRGNKEVARATFWLKRQEALPIPSGMMRRLTDGVLRRWPLLICHAPLASFSGLILPEPPLRDAALETITQCALDLAQQHRASFIVFDYLEQHQAEQPDWPDAFTSFTGLDPGTHLPIVWNDFDSYLGHLSKSARKDYRRHRNRARDRDIVVTSHRTVTDLEEALALIRNVERRHHSPPNPWARAVLENTDLVDTIWLCAEIDTELVGCGLLVGDKGVFFLGLLGLDYEVQYAYFQLFYSAIRCAIEEKAVLLRGGGGAYNLKRRLGFQPENNNHLVFAGRGWLLQRMGRWLATTVRSDDESDD